MKSELRVAARKCCSSLVAAQSPSSRKSPEALTSCFMIASIMSSAAAR